MDMHLCLMGLYLPLWLAWSNLPRVPYIQYTKVNDKWEHLYFTGQSSSYSKHLTVQIRSSVQVGLLSLMKLPEHSRMQLIWMPGHRVIEGNEVCWSVCNRWIQIWGLNRMCHLRQLSSRSSGTGLVEITENTGIPYLDKNTLNAH
jgi:hypothetical protein